MNLMMIMEEKEYMYSKNNSRCVMYIVSTSSSLLIQLPRVDKI